MCGGDFPDPSAAYSESFAGGTFTWARRYNDAVAQFQKVNELNPNFALNHDRLAQLYASLAAYDGAIGEQTKARLMSELLTRRKR